MRAAFIRVDRHRGGKQFVDRFPAVLGTDGCHCRVDVIDGTLVARDLGTGEVRVNGCRVLECPLLPGDHLKVGDMAFRVVYERLALGPLPWAVYPRPHPAGGKQAGAESPGESPPAISWEPASEQH